MNKKLLMIVALLLSANTNANMKASVGVDMSSTDRSSTVNSERNIHREIVEHWEAK